MNILIAPNAYKESLTAMEVAECLRRGFSEHFPDNAIAVFPIADGGDGSLDVMHRHLGFLLKESDVKDPLGRPHKALWGLSTEGDAYIEMALASGLHLLKDKEKNAGLADSYGTGMLIQEALSAGAERIHLFVGGTATMDGGTGILRALGYHFRDSHGAEVPSGGSFLHDINRVDLPGEQVLVRLLKTPVHIYTDVDNPMIGPSGCVPVFAGQKDSGQTDLAALERGMVSFGDFLKRVSGRGVAQLAGSGAAGGMVAGLAAFLPVSIHRGAEKILELCRFSDSAAQADVIITGEGALDSQTLEGKAPFVVARIGKAMHKKLIFIGGRVPGDRNHAVYQHFDAAFSLVPGPVSLDDSMEQACAWLERIGAQVGGMLR